MISPSVLKHCRDGLRNYASWVHDLPDINAGNVASQVEEVVSVIDKYYECSKRNGVFSSEGSQEKEDDIIYSLLSNETHRQYIDIGASHPRENSNTWALYRCGWRGMLIEPMSEYVYQLARVRTGDVVVPVAVSDYCGMIPIYPFRQLTSVDPNWSGNQTEPAVVECLTMKAILDIADYCHFREATFCSIDVEGHERQVLSEIPWDIFRPKVLCIEYRQYSPDVLGADLTNTWEDIVLAQGYVLEGSTTMNKIYRLSQ